MELRDPALFAEVAGMQVDGNASVQAMAVAKRSGGPDLSLIGRSSSEAIL